MKDEERAKLWRTLRVAAAILGTLCVVYGFYVNQVIWTAAGFTAVLLVYYFSSRSSKLREAWFNHAMTTVVRNIERANHYAVQRLPVGIAVFDQEGHLQWKNRLFNEYINVDAPLGSLFDKILPPPNPPPDRISGNRSKLSWLLFGRIRNFHRDKLQSS